MIMYDISVVPSLVACFFTVWHWFLTPRLLVLADSEHQSNRYHVWGPNDHCTADCRYFFYHTLNMFYLSLGTEVSDPSKCTMTPNVQSSVKIFQHPAEADHPEWLIPQFYPSLLMLSGVLWEISPFSEKLTQTLVAAVPPSTPKNRVLFHLMSP